MASQDKDYEDEIAVLALEAAVKIKRRRSSTAKLTRVKMLTDKSRWEQAHLRDANTPTTTHETYNLEKDLRRMLNGFIYEFRHTLLAGFRKALDIGPDYVPAIYQMRRELDKSGFCSSTTWKHAADGRVLLELWIDDAKLLEHHLLSALEARRPH